MPGHGSKVIVSIAGGTGNEKKKEEYGRLHLRLDITSGRYFAMIIVLEPA